MFFFTRIPVKFHQKSDNVFESDASMMLLMFWNRGWAPCCKGAWVNPHPQVWGKGRMCFAQGHSLSVRGIEARSGRDEAGESDEQQQESCWGTRKLPWPPSLQQILLSHETLVRQICIENWWKGWFSCWDEEEQGKSNLLSHIKSAVT